MQRKLHARLKADNSGASAGRFVLPYRFLTNAGYHVSPGNIAEHKGLRARRIADGICRFDATRNDREYRRSVLARDRMDAPIGPVGDISRGDGTGLIRDFSF